MLIFVTNKEGDLLSACRTGQLRNRERIISALHAVSDTVIAYFPDGLLYDSLLSDLKGGQKQRYKELKQMHRNHKLPLYQDGRRLE